MYIREATAVARRLRERRRDRIIYLRRRIRPYPGARVAVGLGLWVGLAVQSSSVVCSSVSFVQSDGYFHCKANVRKANKVTFLEMSHTFCSYTQVRSLRRRRRRADESATADKSAPTTATERQSTKAPKRQSAKAKSECRPLSFVSTMAPSQRAHHCSRTLSRLPFFFHFSACVVAPSVAIPGTAMVELSVDMHAQVPSSRLYFFGRWPLVV